jgi:putative alpha-1,2-mannosidase
MSAWLLFTAFGFYPVNPASNNSAENVYIQSATLNGKSLDVPFITWEQIQAGGVLRFVMGQKPSQWANKWQPPLISPQ